MAIKVSLTYEFIYGEDVVASDDERLVDRVSADVDATLEESTSDFRQRLTITSYPDEKAAWASVGVNW